MTKRVRFCLMKRKDIITKQTRERMERLLSPRFGLNSRVTKKGLLKRRWCDIHIQYHYFITFVPFSGCVIKKYLLKYVKS